jgi:glycosyltransferase involved in cell wall biosynthesis
MNGSTSVGTVVFAWRRIPPPFLIGGAEVSQQLLAEEFAAAGWRTLYLASHEPPWSTTSALPSMVRHLRHLKCEHQQASDELRYTWNGVAIRVLPQARLAAALEEVLNELTPDLVITSQEGSAELAASARSRATVAGWLHSVSTTGLHVLDGKPHYALATSRFVLSRTPPSQAAVLFYPPFRTFAGSTAAVGRDKDLLMINPVPAKGAELVHRLADLLPDRRFTLVEGWWDTSAEFARQPNVTYLPRTYDMEPVYSRHRLLLVPSVVEDAFPRVIVEAALAGLPAIGSDRGGIPEAIGNPELLVPPDDHGAWTALIRLLTHDHLTVLASQAQHGAIPMTRPCLPELAAAGIISG